MFGSSLKGKIRSCLNIIATFEENSRNPIFLLEDSTMQYLCVYYSSLLSNIVKEPDFQILPSYWAKYFLFVLFFLDLCKRGVWLKGQPIATKPNSGLKKDHGFFFKFAFLDLRDI